VKVCPKLTIAAFQQYFGIDNLKLGKLKTTNNKTQKQNRKH
jgi:hypothetical protein